VSDRGKCSSFVFQVPHRKYTTNKKRNCKIEISADAAIAIAKIVSFSFPLPLTRYRPLSHSIGPPRIYGIWHFVDLAKIFSLSAPAKCLLLVFG